MIIIKIWPCLVWISVDHIAEWTAQSYHKHRKKHRNCPLSIIFKGYTIHISWFDLRQIAPCGSTQSSTFHPIELTQSRQPTRAVRWWVEIVRRKIRHPTTTGQVFHIARANLIMLFSLKLVSSLLQVHIRLAVVDDDGPFLGTVRSVWKETPHHTRCVFLWAHICRSTYLIVCVEWTANGGHNRFAPGHTTRDSWQDLDSQRPEDDDVCLKGTLLLAGVFMFMWCCFVSPLSSGIWLQCLPFMCIFFRIFVLPVRATTLPIESVCVLLFRLWKGLR